MFAENLKNLRKAKGLTQVQFAQIFQISSGTIAMWETGKRMPDTETLKRIAKYFDVSLDYLLDAPADETPEEIIILNRNAKKLSQEQQKTLIDVVRGMLKEDFDG